MPVFVGVAQSEQDAGFQDLKQFRIRLIELNCRHIAFSAVAGSKWSVSSSKALCVPVGETGSTWECVTEYNFW